MNTLKNNFVLLAVISMLILVSSRAMADEGLLGKTVDEPVSVGAAVNNKNEATEDKPEAVKKQNRNADEQKEKRKRFLEVGRDCIDLIKIFRAFKSNRNLKNLLNGVRLVANRSKNRRLAEKEIESRDKSKASKVKKDVRSTKSNEKKDKKTKKKTLKEEILTNADQKEDQKIAEKLTAEEMISMLHKLFKDGMTEEQGERMEQMEDLLKELGPEQRVMRSSIIKMFLASIVEKDNKAVQAQVTNYYRCLKAFSVRQKEIEKISPAKTVDERIERCNKLIEQAKTLKFLGQTLEKANQCDGVAVNKAEESEKRKYFLNVCNGAVLAYSLQDTKKVFKDLNARLKFQTNRIQSARNHETDEKTYKKLNELVAEMNKQQSKVRNLIKVNSQLLNSKKHLNRKNAFASAHDAIELQQKLVETFKAIKKLDKEIVSIEEASKLRKAPVSQQTQVVKLATPGVEGQGWTSVLHAHQ